MICANPCKCRSRGFGLPAYRFYRLDGAGKISTGDWIAADDDAQAMAYARDRAEGDRFELWDRNRLVSKQDGESSAPEG